MTRALAAASLILAVLAVPAHAWRRPVPGAVSRAFAYSPAEPFAAGRHRGADFAARPGETVRAACSGRVAYAGRGVVTLRCGPWRVTHLPLATLAVGAGTHVREGARIGTVAASREHAGLHLGVRRAGDRFAYVDPLRLLGPPANVPRAGPLGDAPRRAPPPRPRVVAPAHPAVRIRGVAPWPVWLGLALALAGAAGGGIRVRARSRRALAATATI
jgi:hypothetical protein